MAGLALVAAAALPAFVPYRGRTAEEWLPVLLRYLAGQRTTRTPATLDRPAARPANLRPGVDVLALERGDEVRALDRPPRLHAQLPKRGR